MQQFIIYTKFYCCFGRPWSLEALITKLTLTVALTLTDTVTVTLTHDCNPWLPLFLHS